MARQFIICFLLIGFMLKGLCAAEQSPEKKLPRAGLFTLIVRDPFLKELGLDQTFVNDGGISDMSIAMEAEISEQLRGIPNEDLEKQFEITSRIKTKYEAKLRIKLNPEQFSRLKQIHWHLSGFEAMCEPDVAKALEIDDEKVAKLKIWVRDFYAQLKASTDGVFDSRQQMKEEFASGSNGENLRAKLKKLQDEQEKKRVEIAKGLFEIVTPGQMIDFNELKGRPIMNIVPSRLRHTAEPGDLMMLALREPILKELGIARDAPEVVEIRDLLRKVESESRQVALVPVDQQIDSPGQQAARHRAKYAAEMAKLLRPEQFNRLRQIYWQQLEGQALYDPDVVKQLEMTDEQQTRIADLDFEVIKKGFDLTFAPIHERAYNIDVQQAVQDLAIESDRKKVDILTDEQRKKLTEIKGEPFDMALLLRSQQVMDGPRSQARRKRP